MRTKQTDRQKDSTVQPVCHLSVFLGTVLTCWRISNQATLTPRLPADRRVGYASYVGRYLVVILRSCAVSLNGIRRS